MPHPFLHASARTRWFLLRHHWLRRALVLAVAIAAGVVVEAQLADTRRARAQWTDTRQVLVAAHPLQAGDPIEHRDVRPVTLPRAAVGPGALTELPADLLARHPMATGEPLLAGHVGPARDGELPPGTVGVAVPIPLGSALPATIGTHVDIVLLADETGMASPDGNGSGDDHPTEASLEDLTVTAVADGIAVVAVPEDAAGAVARAASTGRAALVHRSGPLATPPAGP